MILESNCGDMGVTEEPWGYATSEFIVAICVTALNAGAIWISHNLTAIASSWGHVRGVCDRAVGRVTESGH